MFDIQLHHSCKNWDGKFHCEQKNQKDELNNFIMFNKPKHTFWTSSLKTDQSSDWLGFIEYEKTINEQAYFYFKIKDNLSILNFKNNSDVIQAVKKSKIFLKNKEFDLISQKEISENTNSVGTNLIRSNPFENLELFVLFTKNRSLANDFWQWCQENYDGIHVPQKHERFGFLMGWDCESTAWFKPEESLTLITRQQALDFLKQNDQQKNNSSTLDELDELDLNSFKM